MNSITISLKDIQNSPSDTSISIDKLLKNVKSQIDNEDIKVKMRPLLKQVESAKDNVKVDKFSPLIKTYIESQKWITNGELDLKYGIGTGLELK